MLKTWEIISAQDNLCVSHYGKKRYFEGLVVGSYILKSWIKFMKPENLLSRFRSGEVKNSLVDQFVNECFPLYPRKVVDLLREMSAGPLTVDYCNIISLEKRVTAYGLDLAGLITEIDAFKINNETFDRWASTWIQSKEEELLAFLELQLYSVRIEIKGFN